MDIFSHSDIKILYFPLSLTEGVLLRSEEGSRCLSHSYCLTPGNQLHEANQELQFKNTAEDLERWLGDAEQQVASEDYGKGLSDVQNLLRKHGFLVSAVGAHQVGCQLSGHGRPSSRPCSEHTCNK